jgi:hypothetical protein
MTPATWSGPYPADLIDLVTRTASVFASMRRNETGLTRVRRPGFGTRELC